MNYDSLPEGFSLYCTIDLNTGKMKLWLNVGALLIFAKFCSPDTKIARNLCDFHRVNRP